MESTRERSTGAPASGPSSVFMFIPIILWLWRSILCVILFVYQYRNVVSTICFHSRVFCILLVFVQSVRAVWIIINDQTTCNLLVFKYVVLDYAIRNNILLFVFIIQNKDPTIIERYQKLAQTLSLIPLWRDCSINIF